MSSLKQYFDSLSSPDLTLTSVAGSKSELVSSITSELKSVFQITTSPLSESERSKFSSEVAKIATSDQFMEKLSDEIGEPEENESEDQFVERAKSALRKLLTQEVAKK